MERIRTESHIDQLKRRREQIAMTLRHVGRERAELERNTEWVSRDAYQRRAQFLSSVLSWYVTEINQIEKALMGTGENNYGFCAACDELIEARRLDALSESEFCYACQPYKDRRAEL